MPSLATVFYCLYILVVFYDRSCDGGPVFSSAFSVKGTLYIPYAEIEEPFYAWYDGSTGSSRIDYYGGMVKTYQLSRSGKYGSSLKIAPVTTETQTNVNTCLQVNGSVEMKIQSQSILPSLLEFKCFGEEVINGLKTEKWRRTETDGDKISKYTMWIRWKKSARLAQPIPVRYEMKGYNSLLGSHYDHYYLDYEWFSPDAPNSDVFTIEKNMTCTSFPGPGADHIYTFNPMAEYIDHREEHVDAAWDDFRKQHNKKYLDTEYGVRKHTFRQNMRFIHSQNRAGLGYRLAANHLADQTDLELRALRGKAYSPGYNGGQLFPYDAAKEVKAVPAQFDWRLYGAVTPVKDQSVCGSCWSFGTTGIIEGAYFVKTGKLLRLSQQALVDCSWGFGNNGCDGGEDYRAYKWMLKHGGIPSEAEYGPYIGQDGYCHIDKVNLTATITGYVNVTSGDPDALKVALFKHGPISVGIDASHKSLTFYANGIYYEPKCCV